MRVHVVSQKNDWVVQKWNPKAESSDAAWETVRIFSIDQYDIACEYAMQLSFEKNERKEVIYEDGAQISNGQGVSVPHPQTTAPVEALESTFQQDLRQGDSAQNCEPDNSGIDSGQPSP
jgi:hypothetical protein